MSAQATFTDPSIDPQDLTLFQQNILLILADTDDQRDYGLGIKRELEDLYDQDVNHGRLYPNLDALVEDGLVVKGEIDQRTNYYEITANGLALLEADLERREAALADHRGER